MYRNTLGSRLGNKKKDYYGLTLYVYSLEPLDEADLLKITMLFEKQCTKLINKLYPRGNYNFSDYWGSVFKREEKNEPMDYDPDLAETYSYEINQEEEEYGLLEDVL